MKKIISISCLLAIMAMQSVFACEVCQKNQPKVLQNITHGEGPQGNIDFIIIWSSAIIVLAALVMSLKYLIRPNEVKDDHIKNIVLNEN